MKRMASPLGGFVARDTPLSRVDARVKIGILLAMTVSLFATGALWAVLLWLVVLAVAVRAARMDVRSHVRAVRPVAVILAFTLLANALALDGHGDIVLSGPVGIDTAGAVRGTLAVMRIVILLGLALTVSASTTPPELADACTRMLKPLAAFGVPVSDVGLMLSLALRFIPIVSEEFSRVQLAQRSRGVDFERGGLIERVRSWASVLTPLVVSLFRRADRLGESMTARCYTDSSLAGEPARTLAARDRALLAGCLALCVAIPVLAWAL